jgi:hypothetical protein
MPTDCSVRPYRGAEHEQREREAGRDCTHETPGPLEQVADPDERSRGGADDGKQHEVERDVVEPRRIGKQSADREGQRKQPRTHLA